MILSVGKEVRYVAKLLPMRQSQKDRNFRFQFDDFNVSNSYFDISESQVKKWTTFFKSCERHKMAFL